MNDGQPLRCIAQDPQCPCNDGDACHYLPLTVEGVKMTNGTASQPLQWPEWEHN